MQIINNILYDSHGGMWHLNSQLLWNKQAWRDGPNLSRNPVYNIAIQTKQKQKNKQKKIQNFSEFNLWIFPFATFPSHLLLLPSQIKIFYQRPILKFPQFVTFPNGVTHRFTSKQFSSSLKCEKFWFMFERTVAYYIVFARVLHFILLDTLGQEQQVDPGRWLPTTCKILHRLTSQKNEGLYSALVHSIDCLANFC